MAQLFGIEMEHILHIALSLSFSFICFIYNAKWAGKNYKIGVQNFANGWKRKEKIQQNNKDIAFECISLKKQNICMSVC